ncbi:MAG: InlB B-repeat-containing protein [Bacillota bacterium]
MKTKIMRAVSLILVVCVLTGYMGPSVAFAADLGDRVSLENGNISVVVSKANGGFVIRTVDGDAFNKDDNNKDLLFHRSDYDTSFTSFKVTYGSGDPKYYVFGGDYSYRGESSTGVTTEDKGTYIESRWSVGPDAAHQLTFIQTIQPVWATEMNEHGTVAIHYQVKNNTGKAVRVEARLLLDTALGGQDFGYYEVTTTQGQAYERISSERTITGDEIPANFFAYDDYENPSITAYTVNDTAQDGMKPYQVTFAHWNNLAATVFEYTPHAGLTFTNKYNAQYLTADSAYALYYNLDTVASGGEAGFHTYYGIYSNLGVAKGNKFSVNITSPTTLALTSDKKDYVGTYSPTGGPAPLGTFKVTTNLGNIVQEGAQDYSRIVVAAYPDNGITALDTKGNPAGSFSNPYRVTVDNFSVGEVQQLVWGFKASVASAASYRRINFRVYEMPDSANGALLLENVIGSGTCYVLCPGGDGKLPEITFTSASPQMLYFEGTRHFYLTGNQLDLLKAPGNYVLRAQKKDNPGTSYVIPYSNILFSVDQDLGTVIDVAMTEKYDLGEYDLVFEWSTPPAGVPKRLTAPALRFTVTDDKSYKNDYYGIVAVVKTRTGSAATCTYTIQGFPGEVQYDAFKKQVRKDSADDTVYDATKTILFEIRGEFTLKKDASGDITSATAVSSDESRAVIINGVLDIINGKVNIARVKDGGKWCAFISMTGELLTSYSRTPVWTGDAAITPLVDGMDFGFIAYDERGERPDFEDPTDQKWAVDNKINLMWASEYKILQTIAGMVCDLRYAQFGFMHDDDDLFTSYVLSFGASLDISALMPGGRDDDSLPAPPRIEQVVGASDAGMSVAEWRSKNPEKDADDENEEDKTEPTGKVNIKDILYGLNQGYIGFNAEAEVMLPKYTDALPELGGRLAINTIGGYQFEVEGKTKTEAFELEFELVVKSAPDSGAPVPDKIYFFIGEFEPGINIDSVGVMWLTGGGGGIDELYDTIFESGLPPLTLLLSMQFDVLKVLSARADMELSLRGFKVKVDELKIKKTDIVAIESAQFGINWYPDFWLVVAASVDLLEIIEGGCYLVADAEFFEFFIRAILKIPKAIPLIGGLKVLQADFGASMERIWGVVKLLGLGCGICYYWGGDFIFGTGDDAMMDPTYPELLGIKDIPVGYSTETGQTLYMRVTNITTAAAAEIVDDLAAARPVLMAAGDPQVWSDETKKQHKLNLGNDNGNDFVFNVDFPAGGPTTVAAAETAIAVLKPDGNPYALTFYDESGADGTTDASAANANLICDGVAAPGKSAVSISITEHIAGDWTISTNAAADIILYNVAPLPGVSSVTATKPPAGDSLEISWTGTMLEGVKMSFFATSDKGDATDPTGDAGYLLGTHTCTDANGESNLAVAIPPELPSGEYYVRVMASKSEEMRSMHVAANTVDGTAFRFNHTNPDAPPAPTSVGATNAGNLMLGVSVVEALAANSDGYLVNVYEVVDTLQPGQEKDVALEIGPGPDEYLLYTDFRDITFEKDADGNVDVVVGGTYPKVDGKGNPVMKDGQQVVFGLQAGREYKVGVKAFKTATASSGGAGAYEYNAYSPEKLSDAVTLRTPRPPEVTFVTPDPSETPFTVVERTVNSQSLDVVTFTTPAVRFTLTSDEQIRSGHWYIDSDPPQAVPANATSVDIDTKLYDGDHTITFTGVDVDGDRVNYQKLFAVDTLPPSLLVSTSGFFDEDGVLILNAVTGSDSRITVKVDGIEAVDGDGKAINALPISDISPLPVFDSKTGAYSLVIPVNSGVSSHRVDVVVRDGLGHESEPQSFTVLNRGLSNIGKLDILSDGVLFTGNDIEVDETNPTTRTLSLMATTKSASPNSFVIDDPDLVIWSADVVEGTATITQSGGLTIEPGSIGMVTGSYRVAEAGAKIGGEPLAGEMTAAVTFGAGIFTQTYDGRYKVDVGTTIGGTVSGEGWYVPGAVVTVTATPKPGYRFVGWSSPAGVVLADPSSRTTTFTMPAQNVTVTAQFKFESSPRVEEELPGAGTDHFSTQGSIVSILLPPDVAAQGSNVVAYYMLNGVRHIVQACAVINGRLVFQAPVTGMFGYMANDVYFSDTSGHWAENAIRFAAAREILRGVGEGRFDPQGQITRAMFVTMLSRLDGILEGSGGNTGFTDVRPGSYYEAAVKWAKDNGIVGGVSPTEFDPDAPISREHMAIMLYRYITYKNYQLSGVGSSGAFNDGNTLSEQGGVAAQFMRLWGIMDGKPGNVFDGRGRATRAEGAVVLMRLIEAVLRR